MKLPGTEEEVGYDELDEEAAGGTKLIEVERVAVVPILATLLAESCSAFRWTQRRLRACIE